MIRVGKRKYTNGSYIDPSYPNFVPIICMTASTDYYSLSPYSLKDEKGRILENIWQFSKVYEKVHHSVQKYSRWSYPEEQHAIPNPINNTYDILPNYHKWRHKGMNNPYPVRYPVGYNHRSSCLFSLAEDD